MQMNFSDLLVQEKRDVERNLPWYLQAESAWLVKYTGEPKTGLPNGALGFICGSVYKNGERLCIFQWRSASKEVSLLDLTPMKVTDFTEEDRGMLYPKPYEYVEIVENSSMKVIDKGYLTTFKPDTFCLKDRDQVGKFLNKRSYDARVHHFKGYKPKRLLVWRDENA